MKITIELDDVRSIIERSGLIPHGYKIERVEQGAYTKEIDIHCERIVDAPLSMDRMFKAEGERPTFPLRPMQPCVRDSEDI